MPGVSLPGPAGLDCAASQPDNRNSMSVSPNFVQPKEDLPWEGMTTCLEVAAGTWPAVVIGRALLAMAGLQAKSRKTRSNERLYLFPPQSHLLRPAAAVHVLSRVQSKLGKRLFDLL